MQKPRAKYRGTKLYDEVYKTLIVAARQRRTVTYKQIAEIMGLPLSGNNMAKETGRMSGVICEDEVKRGRHMLGALIVHSRGDKMPGPGFFELAKDLGRPIDETKEGRQLFWENERDKVYAEWQDKH